MEQIYYLEIISPCGLKSKEKKFKYLSQLFEYIKKNDYIGYSYLITKRF